MKPSDFDTHLSRIPTLWGLVKQAHGDDPAAARDAQRQLVERYEKAVKRFLKAILPSSEEVEDLYQEFALRLIRGDFHRADPTLGRFRDFVKTVLRNLVRRHHHQRQRTGPLPDDSARHPSVDPDTAGFDQQFDAAWRDDLLHQAWQRLQEVEQHAQAFYYSVLLLRSRHPAVPAAELAEQLSRTTGKAITEASFRQTLKRARKKFAELLREEVARSLKDATPDQVAEELSHLGLLDYCRPASDEPGEEGR